MLMRDDYAERIQKLSEKLSDPALAELAKKNLNHLKHMDIKQPVLAIFDRGYPSIEFIDFLETEKIRYLFRLSSNDYKFERGNIKTTNKTVILRHTYQQLEKIREKYPERFKHMKEKEVQICGV